jgi:carboxypeptidase C (cathepsin A)
MMNRFLSCSLIALLLVFVWVPTNTAKEISGAAASAEPKSEGGRATPETPAPEEESSVTEHKIRIGGQTIPYKASAATTLLKNSKNEPTALLYSTAYTRSDVKDHSRRPIAFIFNGGPGSSSIWLHMGAFGPRRVVTKDASATPPAPYKIADNDGTLLDKADLVFIDPVGTGFSHAVGEAEGKDFWGVDQDVESLAQFINTYISRNNRWNSPKFLIGESYGTFRAVALAEYLQSTDGIPMNGIVLISSVLDMGTLSFSPGDDRSYIFYLPTYAAAAWHFDLLQDRPDDLDAFLDDARRFASNEYATALMKGSKLSSTEAADIAEKLAGFTGLGEDYLIKANLRVVLPQFQAELQRSRGLTIGRFDARYVGETYDLLTQYSEFDPSFSGILGAFTAAFNSYVRNDLKFGDDKTYKVLPMEPYMAWDWKQNSGQGSYFPGAPNVEGDLIRTLIENPHLQVQVENGVFDMATPFFATEYTMDHLLLPESAMERIHMNYYDSGHMMYLNEEDLSELKSNIDGFIDKTVKSIN